MAPQNETSPNEKKFEEVITILFYLFTYEIKEQIVHLILKLVIIYYFSLFYDIKTLVITCIILVCIAPPSPEFPQLIAI